MELRLPARAPFDGEALVAFLGARAVPGVEAVEGGTYRRSLGLARGAGVAAVTPAGHGVLLHLTLDDERDRDEAVARCRALFDLGGDAAAVLGALGGDPVLGPLVRAAPGRRVPGAADAHELATRAVLGQQVSLAGAATLAGRLVRDLGAPLARPAGGVTHVFPTAAALAGSDAERLAMPRSRRAALLGLARALAEGDVVLAPGADPAAARAALLALPGIGPWTAEYIAMRALGDRDAFLASDLGVRHALERLGQDGRPPAAARLAERWRPYRASAVVHLWAHLTSPAPAALST